MAEREVLYDAKAVNEAVERIADAISGEFCSQKSERFALIGLHKQGVPLSERIAELIFQRCGFHAEIGKLDISMYRDDVGGRTFLPRIRETVIPFDVEGNNIVLVDDILSTGRTIRAALDAITDFGRPKVIRLAVLVNRNSSEYPIHADYQGFSVNIPDDIKLQAEFTGDDAADAVYQVQWLKN